ncbi:MAG TPA: ATP-binding cassette domain-containing protein, partial [Paenibacillus sp.]|nr:ATP-binding cassette domain-containing protein [Paenibacillus sp.]
MRSGSPILTLEDVSFVYDGAETPAVRGVTLAVGEGERLAVVGPGGSGKSTFCRLVRGALTASAAAGDGRLDGRIRLRGADASVPGGAAYTALEAAGRIGAVTQDPETGLAMDVVEDEIAFGPENLCVPASELEARVDASLAAVGLTPALRPARTSELSGGQQQRVAIAAALAMEPALLVLDDAAANLDAPGASLLRETLRGLHRRGATLVETSPRWDGAADADRVAVLSGGRLLAVGAPADVLAAHGDALRRLGLLPRETGLAMDVVEDEIAFGPENLCVPASDLEARVDDSLAAVGLTPALRP